MGNDWGAPENTTTDMMPMWGGDSGSAELPLAPPLGLPGLGVSPGGDGAVADTEDYGPVASCISLISSLALSGVVSAEAVFSSCQQSYSLFCLYHLPLC
jgi:hypothetical protein